MNIYIYREREGQRRGDAASARGSGGGAVGGDAAVPNP